MKIKLAVNILFVSAPLIISQSAYANDSTQANPFVLRCTNSQQNTIKLNIPDPGFPLGAQCRMDKYFALSANDQGKPFACFKGMLYFGVSFPASSKMVIKYADFDIHNFDGIRDGFYFSYIGKVDDDKIAISFEPKGKGSIVMLRDPRPPVVFQIEKDCQVSRPILELSAGLWLKKSQNQ